MRTWCPKPLDDKANAIFYHEATLIAEWQTTIDIEVSILNQLRSIDMPPRTVYNSQYCYFLC